jgi:hypothetical protein
MPATLSKILSESGRDCWLALSEDESSVVGRGDTPEEAVKEAQRAGVSDPILIWAPKTWTPSVYY